MLSARMAPMRSSPESTKKTARRLRFKGTFPTKEPVKLMGPRRLVDREHRFDCWFDAGAAGRRLQPKQGRGKCRNGFAVARAWPEENSRELTGTGNDRN